MWWQWTVSTNPWRILIYYDFFSVFHFLIVPPLCALLTNRVLELKIILMNIFRLLLLFIRSGRPVIVKSEKSTDDPNDYPLQATKRQRLETGHFCKVSYEKLHLLLHIVNQFILFYNFILMYLYYSATGFSATFTSKFLAVIFKSIFLILTFFLPCIHIYIS